MRLTPHERRQIEQPADLRATTMKEAVLEAVQRRLDEIEREKPFVPKGRLNGAEHLIGCFRSGLDDLSTNKSYLEGYGE